MTRLRRLGWRALLRLFPAPFRARFGAEMAAQLERDLERARTRGALAVVACAAASAADLARAAFAERLEPTWIAPRAARPNRSKEDRMRRLVSEWTDDLRHAARTLRRAPGFAAVSGGTLGLAIGATAALFAVVDAVLLQPLPFEHVDRLVHIGASAPGSDMPPEFGTAPEFYLQYRELSHLLEDVSTYNSFTNTFRTADRVERIRMSYPTPTLFSTLGARPSVGRLPTATDGPGVMVISDALWSSWFARDPGVIGRGFEIFGESRTVIGVMPPEFHFPNDTTMLWLSDPIRAEGLTPGRFRSSLVARMKPGVTPEQLAAELTDLARRLPERFGGTPNYARIMEKHRALVRPLEEQLVGSVARPLWLLLAAAGVVLLVAGANVANLFLVRAETRQRDLAVRRAIGAARGQLVRLQMAEALVVALLAALLAVGLAAFLLPGIVRAAPSGIPRLAEAGLHPATLLFTLAAALVSALVCGLAPALRASAPDLNRLRDGGRGATPGRRWARAALVSAQTALSLLLLIGSGLLIRSHMALSRVDPGYETADRFTFQIAPERPELKDGPSYARFHLDFLARLAKLPGVESVGLVENVPLNEGTAEARVYAEGQGAEGDGGTMINVTFTAGDYFRTMGIALEAGRPFRQEDHLTQPGNAILSRSAVNRLWPGDDPSAALGRRFKTPFVPELSTVVGVVEDVLQDSFREAAEPLIYLPMIGPQPDSWYLESPAYVVKTARAETIAPEIRALARAVAPEAPMYREFTMAGLARDSMVDLSFTLLTLCIAATLALLLGAVGLYGVLSYLVAQRTREIGVRMALGARAVEVRRMVVAQGARVIAFGVALGLVASFVSTRALSGLLYGVAPADAATYVLMTASMVGVGLLASWLPAWRASRVAPVESLRAD